MKKLVIFVCSGNTCRSPIAEHLLKNALKKLGIADKFTVCSAGISATNGSSASNLAIEVMKNFSSDISLHSSQQINQKLIDDAHALFCLTSDHKNYLLSNFKNVKGKCYLTKEFLSDKNKNIADPFLGSVNDYIETRDEINSAIDSIVKFLEGNL